jgi:hypothetical protein
MMVRIRHVAVLGVALSAPLAANAQPHPDITGIWTRGAAFDTAFKPPPSGPGPVMNLSPAPRGRRGGGDGISHWQGDYSAPILQPWAAEKVRAHTEADRAGKPMNSAQETCWPMGVPYILELNQQAQIFEDAKHKKVVFLYERHMQPRIVPLDVPHRTNLKPSWFGDSVAHWESDTLVIDTIGLDTRTWVDVFATPHTEKLHVVERYRLTDANTLETTVQVEDPGAFTTPWSGVVTYKRDTEPYLEVACMENNVDPVTRQLYDGLPIAQRPDF